MFRVIVLLAIGITIGYFIGFKDARKHTDNVVKRIVDRVGGDARSRVSNDIDARLEKQGGR